MARRSPETLADYLVVAISPALIMLLVGSLVFFLIEVFYQGQYETRLLFVMAMFVMAIVCVARISMEEGAGKAALFGFPLAVVTALALARFVKVEGPLAAFGPLVNWGLMALIWWSAHKLTWDCTLIDDTQDASGHGLLQELGFDRPEGTGGAAPSLAMAGASDPVAAEATTGQPALPLPWWQNFLEADRRPHSPGLWVVYFSLAALPLFGIGGCFIPASASDVRQRAFLFLVVYVAAGLTLLLSTSFLGLRRYLRQRRLEMPLEMTASWVGLGLAMIVATLLVCALLPRPDSLASLAKLPIEFTSPDNRANRVAAGPEGAPEDPHHKSSSAADAQKNQTTERDGSGKPQKGKSDGGQTNDSKSGKGEQKGKSGGDSGKPSNQGKVSQQDPSSGKSDEQQSGQKGSPDSGEQKGSEGGKGSQGKGSGGEKPSKPDNNSNSKQPPTESRPQPSSTAQANSPPPPPPPAPPASNIQVSWGGALAWLLRAAFYLGLLIAAVALAYIYREQLLAAWRKLLAELQEMFARWFGPKPQPASEIAASAARLPPSFATFTDPFASGAAGRMSWAELVRYTFQALEAFGRERGCPRATGQTPHEFAQALTDKHPPLGQSAATLADWYGQLAYASRSSPASAPDPLRQLWQCMRNG